jgi:hypothetical protein
MSRSGYTDECENTWDNTGGSFGSVVPTPTERVLFDLIELPWTPPEQREVS